jgi:hypothetical protein
LAHTVLFISKINSQKVIYGRIINLLHREKKWLGKANTQFL